MSFASVNATGTITTTSNTNRWVNFSPHGDDDSTNNNNNNELPLDTIMNDIEHQMNEQNDAIVGMARKLEDIEVCLSRQEKTPSPRSLPFAKKSSYISMIDDDDDRNIAVGESDIHRSNDRYTSKKENRSSSSSSSSSSLRKQYILRMLQQRTTAGTETNGNNSNINNDENEPVASPTNFTVRELVPPTQVQNPRRKLKLKIQSQISDGFPVAQEEELPPPRGEGGSTKLDLSIARNFRSSLTWDESVSSHPSGVSDDLISELDDSVTGKTMFFRSRKAKYALIFLAGILFLLIGLLLGQWARGQSGNVSQPSQQQQQQQQQQQAVDSPVTQQKIEEEDASNIEVNVFETMKPSVPATTAPPVAVPTKELVVTEEQTNPNASESGFDYTANTDFLVGVYYYPWHGERFHNGDGYMRKELTPQHVPALGEYNDSDPDIIREHMKMFRQANIGLLVTSWWGPNRLEDSNTKDVIMEHEDVGNLKVSIHYETTSRLGQGRDKLSNARTDIQYMCENYFDHPNYYKIDGRPVLFIYISRKLQAVGTLEEALLIMRSTASKCGHNLYLIGDSVFEEAPDSAEAEAYVPFWYFDAVTNYDIYGSSGRPEGHVGTDRVDNYYRQQGEWKEQALKDGCRYIPATSPGYNDRGVRMESDHPPLSRRITSTSQEGSLFQYQLHQAKELVDSKVDNMILVNSFNEWHEDTQIEPVVGEPSSEPFNFTKGVEYVGYGDLYLDILGAATSKDKSQHTIFDYLL
jgi:glycoprotein endo-alpha-1,2-mannosidase